MSYLAKLEIGDVDKTEYTEDPLYRLELRIRPDKRDFHFYEGLQQYPTSTYWDFQQIEKVLQLQYLRELSIDIGNVIEDPTEDEDGDDPLIRHFAGLPQTNIEKLHVDVFMRYKAFLPKLCEYIQASKVTDFNTGGLQSVQIGMLADVIETFQFDSSQYYSGWRCPNSTNANIAVRSFRNAGPTV